MTEPTWLEQAGFRVFTDCRIPHDRIVVGDSRFLVGPRTCTDDEPCDQHRTSMTVQEATFRLNGLWGLPYSDLANAIRATEEHVATLRDAIARLREIAEDARKGRSKWHYPDQFPNKDITGEYP